MNCDTNGSVLAAIVSDDDIVLGRQPTKKPPIYWKLIGGRIKNHETPEQTVVREVKEEADIDLTGQKLIRLGEFPQNGSGGPYVQYLFAVAVSRELVAKHRAGIVEMIDDNYEKIESTCFKLSQLDKLPDMMDKHKNFIRQLQK